MSPGLAAAPSRTAAEAPGSRPVSVVLDRIEHCCHSPATRSFGKTATIGDEGTA
jgi:hypothetical protein